MAAKGLLQSLLLSAFLFPLTSHATTFVKGNIDAPSGNNTSFTIKGWACQTERNQSINVHVYSGGRAGLGGRFLTSATANKSSAQGIANACNNSVTTNNRFSINLTQEQIYQHRGREIFVHGISLLVRQMKQSQAQENTKCRYLLYPMWLVTLMHYIKAAARLS